MEAGNRRLPLGELQESSESRTAALSNWCPKNKSSGTGVEERGGAAATGARLPQLTCSDRCASERAAGGSEQEEGLT